MNTVNNHIIISIVMITTIIRRPRRCNDRYFVMIMSSTATTITMLPQDPFNPLLKSIATRVPPGQADFCIRRSHNTGALVG